MSHCDEAGLKVSCLVQYQDVQRLKIHINVASYRTVAHVHTQYGRYTTHAVK